MSKKAAINNPIKFYFVCLSPWAYLAIDNLASIASRHERTVEFKPIDVGRAWQETEAGKPLHDRPLVLKEYRMIELERWAEWRGVVINRLPKYHPVPFALSSNVIIAAMKAGLDVLKITRALMQGCWVYEKDISNADDVRAILEGIGVDSKPLLELANSDEIASVLVANTNEALSDGAWSVPSFIIDGELFFGQDRLEMIEWRLSNQAHS